MSDRKTPPRKPSETRKPAETPKPARPSSTSNLASGKKSTSTTKTVASTPSKDTAKKTTGGSSVVSSRTSTVKPAATTKSTTSAKSTTPKTSSAASSKTPVKTTGKMATPAKSTGKTPAKTTSTSKTVSSAKTPAKTATRTNSLSARGGGGQLRTQPIPRPIREPRPYNPNSFGNRLRRFLEDPDAFKHLGQSMPSWADEFGAILLIIVGVFALTALLNPVGDAAVSTSLAKGLRQTFGVGSFVVALTVVGMGILLLLPKVKVNVNLKFDWMRILAVEIAFISLQGLFHLLTFEEEGRALARAGKGGGYVGWAISSVLSTILGSYLAICVLIIGMGYSLVLALHVRRTHVRQSLEWVGTRSQDLSTRVRPIMPTKPSYTHQSNGDLIIGAAAVGVAAATMSGSNGTPIVENTYVLESAPSVMPPATGGVKAEAPYENYARPESVPAIPDSLPGVNSATPTRAERPARAERTGRSTPPPPPPLPAQALPAQPIMEVVAVMEKAADGPPVLTPTMETAPIVTEIASAPLAPLTNETAAVGINMNEIEDMTDDEMIPTGPIEPRRNTLVINGQVVNLPTNGDGAKPRPTNLSNGKRYFTVDGFQDRVMVGERPENLPPLELLGYSALRLPSEEEVNNNARIIEHTMIEFDIDADVIDVRVGPTVTQYAVSPIKEVYNAAGERTVIRTRVGKIAALNNDLALALSAKSVRIEAPVPGHAYVGVEVPNREPSIVSLRSVLESEAFYKERHKPLAVPLGRDVSGEPLVADLAIMPHMLIAGTTGSGKSVALTAMIASLVMNNTPDKLRMIILDPKMVEMVHFNGLPHLLGPVETDTERIIGVLRWATREMDRRYKLLELENSRHLEAYNKAVIKKGKPEEQLPYIVIVIDEIGDLMMMRPDETEKTVTRLAQKARAAGMHLVIATQRPSVDVITGLIKANFPARISFAVASGTDSRVILDSVGAEALVGKGDMLFLAPDAAGPKRVQGCYVSDDELYEIVMYWKSWHEEQQAEEQMEVEAIPPWERGMTRLETLSELDSMLEEALSLVVLDGEASTSLIQRRLGIGYPRAARLMDSLHELGIIGEPLAGGRSRRVLVKSIDEARRMVRNNRRQPPGGA